MKRVVHIIFSFETGGTETMLIDILNLQSDSVEVSLMIVNKVIDENLLSKLNKRIHITKFNRKPKSLSPLPFISLNLKLLTINPAIIHIHDNTILPAIFHFGSKKVITVHCLNQKFNPKLVNTIVAISKTVQQDIEHRLKAKSTLIYNGIRSNEISISTDETNQNKGFRIVQVGRLAQIKGQQILILALHEIVKNGNPHNIELDFIGSGPNELNLKKLVSDLGLKPFVNFLGNKDRSYIYQHLKSYNLLVQPSLEEGFGLTIAEAMVARVPVLVSAIPAQMEIIDYGAHGKYFESENAVDCAKKIIEQIENPINRTESGRQYAIENFDIAKTVQNYLNIY